MQVTLDMPFSVAVPEGHGHRYTRESVDAWATVLQPADWSTEKAHRLRARLRDDRGSPRAATPAPDHDLQNGIALSIQGKTRENGTTRGAGSADRRSHAMRGAMTEPAGSLQPPPPHLPMA